MSKTKDEQIDMLLTFMKDEIESEGSTPQTCHFDFNLDKEDFLAFKAMSRLTEKDIDKTLKICRSRKYIKYHCMGEGDLFMLTAEGHGRAISVEGSKNYTERPREPSVNTGNITVHGPTQIGNNNIQNIENVIGGLIEKIDNADASEKEKKEAKSRLRAFLEHPLTNTAIGAGTSALIALCGGA